ncbi:MAG TPA: lamin tail domain-containing protein, partial [Gaiellaceae bacterium]|nr:lamin tail domain-containing protein [Gaiellaceae bacterium]
MLVIAVGVLSFGSIGSAASTSLVINEVDYDQPATDTAEFLELKNVSGAPIDLDAYRIELTNGATAGSVYQTIELPAASLAPGDYYVVCASTTTTANCDLDVAPDSNLIQNGAPDGMRLMLADLTVDALSYEGNTTGSTEVSGIGLEDTAVAAGEGLSRCPDGADSDVNNADFSLRAISPGTANGCAGPKVVINEVDYDQPGTDGAEFLELKNTSAAAANLDPYVVELVNGSGGAVYATFDLPAVSLAGGDYYVICASTTTTANCDLDVAPDSNLIQNGSPDGLRLVLAGTTVDALSYEGDTAGATEGSGTGLEDLADQGLSRCPDG